MNRNTIIRFELKPDEDSFSTRLEQNTLFCEDPVIYFMETYVQILGVGVNIVLERKGIARFEVEAIR